MLKFPFDGKASELIACKLLPIVRDYHDPVHREVRTAPCIAGLLSQQTGLGVAQFPRSENSDRPTGGSLSPCTLISPY